MSVFTPVSGLLGGTLIGASAGLLLVSNGDVMGISGIFRSSILHPGSRWKMAYVSAFLLAAQLYRGSDTASSAATTTMAGPTTLALVLGGACVGMGTQMGNGCTSGHGICGLARYSVRSLAAVLTFCGVGAAVASTIASVETLSQLLRTTEPMLTNNLWGAAMVGISVVMLLMTKQQATEGQKTAAALASGAVSSVGMCVSGMAKVSKVLGFLEVSRLFSSTNDESWDPTLTMVMASGVLVSWLCYQLRPESSPVCAPEYSVPTNSVINKRLITGASLFGIGWAVAGLCPGPALWNAGAGSVPVIMYWLPAFIAGSFAGESLSQTSGSSSSPGTAAPTTYGSTGRK